MNRRNRDSAQKPVHGGNENKRGKSREQQPADDGAGKRRILLAAFADAKRHRNHAEDHRARRHQHGAQARKPRHFGGNPRVVARIHALIGKSHDQNAVGGRKADAHQRSHQRRNAEMRLRQDTAST